VGGEIGGRVGISFGACLGNVEVGEEKNKKKKKKKKKTAIF